MSRRRIHVCPTIGAGWLHIPSLQDALGPALERMRAQGVPIIAGSDAGAIPNLAFHRLADGIVVMARCGGFGHAEALRSATSTAACALGLQSVCGALVESLSADLIVVQGNPIEELEAICAPPLAIVCRGKPVAPCRAEEIGFKLVTVAGMGCAWWQGCGSALPVHAGGQVVAEIFSG